MEPLWVGISFTKLTSRRERNADFMARSELRIHHGTFVQFTNQELDWVVVSNIFYFHPYLGKIPILINIFSKGLKPPTRRVRLYIIPHTIPWEELCIYLSMNFVELLWFSFRVNALISPMDAIGTTYGAPISGLKMGIGVNYVPYKWS